MTAKKAAARPSRTRAETKQKFEEIVEARGDIDATDEKSAAAARNRAAFVKQAVHGMTVEGVVKAAGDLKLAASAALDDVTSKLQTKVEELELTNEAIALATAELENLHQLDVAKTSIDILIEEHNETKERFKKEYLEARAAWEAEQKNHTDQVRLRDVALQTERNRERDEYEYKKAAERRQKEDEFLQQLLTRQRAERERQAEFDKNITERELAITKQEADILSLRTQVEGFDERLKKEKDAAVAIATNSLKKDLTQEFALAKKDLDTSLRIAQSDVAAKDATVKKQEDTIVALQARIVELQAQVVATASKAIDGASKADAFNQYMQAQRENGAVAQQKRGS